MPKRTRDHHAWLVEELKNPVIASNYLNEALQDSPQMFLKALRNVGEVLRLSVIAKEAGFRRETLYRSLSRHGNPRLKTLNAVLGVLGLGIQVEPKKSQGSSQPGPAQQLQRSALTVQPRHRYRHTTTRALSPGQLTLPFETEALQLPSQPSSPLMEGLTPLTASKQMPATLWTGKAAAGMVPTSVTWKAQGLSVGRSDQMFRVHQTQDVHVGMPFAPRYARQAASQGYGGGL